MMMAVTSRSPPWRRLLSVPTLSSAPAAGSTEMNAGRFTAWSLPGVPEGDRARSRETPEPGACSPPESKHHQLPRFSDFEYSV